MILRSLAPKASVSASSTIPAFYLIILTIFQKIFNTFHNYDDRYSYGIKKTKNPNEGFLVFNKFSS